MDAMALSQYTAYITSMARKMVCPVCDSERFRQVVVKLPSGKERVTDFEACKRCRTVFHRPDEPTATRDSNVSDFAWYVPSNVSAEISKTFPDANSADVEVQTAQYQHPNYGRLVLIFKRKQTHGTNEAGMKWYLVEAKRLTE